MANRIVLLVSLMLTGVALAVTPGSAEPAAEECLAKPKGPAPAGRHWYYRTNRELKRKCWFLGDAGAKTVAATLPKEAVLPPEKPEELVAATSADPDDKPGKQPQAANAHAELIDKPQREQPLVAATQPEPEAQPEADVWPPLEALPAAPAAAEAESEAWTIASRWPDEADAFSADQPSVSADRRSVADDPMPATPAENPSPPVLTAKSLVPLEQPSTAAESSDNMSLAQLAAGLIFLAVGGGAIFMFFAPGRRRDMRDVMYRDDMSPTRFEDVSAMRTASRGFGTREG